MSYLGIVHRAYRPKELEIPEESAASSSDNNTEEADIPISVALSALSALSISEPTLSSSNNRLEVISDVGKIIQWNSLLKPLRSDRSGGAPRGKAPTISSPLDNNKIERLLRARYKEAMGGSLEEGSDSTITGPTPTDHKLAALARKLSEWSTEYRKIFRRLQESLDSENEGEPLTSSEIVFLTGFTGVVRLVAEGNEVFPSARDYLCKYPMTPAKKLLSGADPDIARAVRSTLMDCDQDLDAIVSELTDPNNYDDPDQNLYERQYRYVHTVEEIRRTLTCSNTTNDLLHGN